MTTSERDRPPADECERLQREVANSDSLICSKLAAELRNEIWRLTVPEIVSLDSEYSFSWRTRPTATFAHLHGENLQRGEPPVVVEQIKLLQICGQMRREIFDFFFSEPTFLFPLNLTTDFDGAARGSIWGTIQFLEGIDSNAVTLLRDAVLLEYSSTINFERVVRLDLELRDARPVTLCQEHDYGGGYEWSPYPCDAEIEDILRSISLKSDAWAKKDKVRRRRLLSWFRSFSTWGEVLEESFNSMVLETSTVERYEEWKAGRAEEVSDLAQSIDEVE